MRAETSRDIVPSSSWILAARAAVLSIALLAVSLASIYSSILSADSVQYLFIPIVSFYLLTGISAFWLKWREAGSLFYVIQIGTDISLVTGIIYVSGGPTSPFQFFYLLVVMASAIFLSRKAALITAALASASYAALIFGLLTGKLYTLSGTTLESYPLPETILQLIGLSSASVLIAIATDFLTKSIKNHAALAELREKNLDALHKKQQLVFDRLPEGVVSVDLDDRITGINEAACKLLGICEEIIGLNTTDITEKLSTVWDVDGEIKKNIPRGELTLTKGEDTHKLQYLCKELVDDNKNPIGKLFIFQDVTRLRSVEEQLATHERMAKLLSRNDTDLEYQATKLAGFVGESTVMKKVFGLIERVAPSDATVLISGESGTGKELVAKAIHLGSKRASQPFVPINCGAIPENLLESEFFGHKKGAYTGAVSDALGLFRRAEGGTIFLDEIGELPLHMQAKLLRAIQEKSVRPVGGDSSIPVNVRIIAATNKNLKLEVEKKQFRDDLFYRLNVITISLPALRQRRDDIPILIKQIMKRITTQDSPPTIAPQAMQLLMNYSYPGNVRELENILERAVVLGGDAVLVEHLPEAILAESGKKQVLSRAETEIIIDEDITFPVDLEQVLASIEQHYLKLALLESNGVKKTAAELLGINFRSFRYRLQKFEVEEKSH